MAIGFLRIYCLINNMGDCWTLPIQYAISLVNTKSRRSVVEEIIVTWWPLKFLCCLIIWLDIKYIQNNALLSSAFLKHYLFTFTYFIFWFLQVHDTSGTNVGIDHIQIDSDMQELVQVVLQNSSNGIDFEVKQKFLTVTKSFYYCAYCNSKTTNFHIDKVLFESVEWSVCSIVPQGCWIDAYRFCHVRIVRWSNW